jgi:hypothetical protein
MVKITGAMFFAAAEGVLRDLLDSTETDSNLILYADGITISMLVPPRRFTASCRSAPTTGTFVSLSPISSPR